jgi:hypothetical protein
MSYDKQQRVLKYYHGLATLVKKANEMNMMLTRLEAEEKLVFKDTKTTEMVQRQRTEIRSILEKATTESLEMSHASSLENAERLCGQLESRVNSLDDLQKAIRDFETQLELALSMDDFASNTEGRARAEEQLPALRARFDKQLELADNLIPASSTLIQMVH